MNGDTRPPSTLTGAALGAGSAGPLRGRTLLAAAVIVAAAVAAYANSFNGPFLFDDLRAIRDNPDLQQNWQPWRIIFTPTYRTRPVAGVTFGFNYALGGLDVRGYHAVNLAIHILAALTLFGLVRRILGIKALGPYFAPEEDWPALATALLWAVHPLQTQAVTYIIQRCESLMGLFYLLTLYAVVRGTASPRPRRWYAAAVLACALGMGTKQVMVTAPVLALLVDRTLLAGTFREALRRRWGLYAALAATWLMLAPHFLGAWFHLLAVQPAGQPHLLPTPWEHLRTQFGVVAHYLRLAVWPRGLCLDYGWPVATTVGEILPPALLLAALGAASLWALIRRPTGAGGTARRAAGLAGAAFFLILAPTSSIVPMEDAAFDHRMYLPLAAVAALVVGVAYAIGARVLRRPDSSAAVRRGVAAAGGLAVIAVAVALGFLTLCRNRDYCGAVRIWSDTAAKAPANARAHCNLGKALAAADRPDEAIAEYREALRLRPAYPEALNNLGVALAEKGMVDVGLRHLQEAIALQPDYADAWVNLGMLGIRLCGGSDAEFYFRRALEIDPRHAAAHHGLGYLLACQGKSDEAETHLRRALELDPRRAATHDSLGVLLATRGNLEEAIVHYREALRLEPRSAQTHTNLGLALERMGQRDAAIAAFREALRIDPSYAEARDALAKALGRTGG